MIGRWCICACMCTCGWSGGQALHCARLCVVAARYGASAEGAPNIVVQFAIVTWAVQIDQRWCLFRQQHVWGEWWCGGSRLPVSFSCTNGMRSVRSGRVLGVTGFRPCCASPHITRGASPQQQLCSDRTQWRWTSPWPRRGSSELFLNALLAIFIRWIQSGFVLLERA